MMKKSFLILLSFLIFYISAFAQNINLDTTQYLNIDTIQYQDIDSTQFIEVDSTQFSSIDTADILNIDTTEVIEDRIVEGESILLDYIDSLNDTITKTDIKEVFETLSKNYVLPPDYLETLDDTISTKGMKGVLEVFEKDSILPSDYMLYLNDSLALDSIQGFFDFLNELDSTFNYELYFYRQLLDYVRDSSFFDTPDSTYYVVYKLNDLVNRDTIILSDSSKQAIEKLINYTTSRQIEPVINYLKYQIDSANVEFTNPSLKLLNDSIFNAISYLLNEQATDSVDLYFSNKNGESKLFRTNKGDLDSIRINLYDNRGERATLWIEKTDENVLNFYVEDGVYLEKSRAKKVYNKGLDYDSSLPELKKMQKFEKIIPIWKFRGSADIKFDYGFVSKSWSEDGESSMSALSDLKYSAEYSYGKLRNFLAEVEYVLGYMQTGDDELQKNDDRFQINFKYGRSAFNDWYYSGFILFKTQFLDGFDYDDDTTILRSGLLSPADLVFSIGIDYKPNSKFAVLMSPVTSKYTIFSDTTNYDQTHFGVDEGKKFRREFGAYINATWIAEINDRLKMENRLNLFTNYTDDPQNIDVEWKLKLGFMVTDYIKVSLDAHFIYDDDDSYIDENYEERGAKPQFKELFGVGFSYEF